MNRGNVQPQTYAKSYCSLHCAIDSLGCLFYAIFLIYDCTNNHLKNIKSDTKLINLLRQAIEATEEDNGWASLSGVGSHISNKTSFDSRNYGYKNLSSLFKAIDLFEVKRDTDNSYLVRDKRKKK